MEFGEERMEPGEMHFCMSAGGRGGGVFVVATEANGNCLCRFVFLDFPSEPARQRSDSLSGPLLLLPGLVSAAGADPSRLRAEAGEGAGLRCCQFVARSHTNTNLSRQGCYLLQISQLRLVSHFPER